MKTATTVRETPCSPVVVILVPRGLNIGPAPPSVLARGRLSESKFLGGVRKLTPHDTQRAGMPCTKHDE
jgi:hypothetical protein